MKATVYIYKTDGTKVIKEFDRMVKLEELREAVGGSIESVPFWTRHIGRECVAFCNEEGKLNELPINEHATALWYIDAPIMRGKDVLVGDVVVVMGDKMFMEEL